MAPGHPGALHEPHLIFECSAMQFLRTKYRAIFGADIHTILQFILELGTVANNLLNLLGLPQYQKVSCIVLTTCTLTVH